ncbi:Origin recognition complex, subunit 1 [Sorochytrium milnesiophthora]
MVRSQRQAAVVARQKVSEVVSPGPSRTRSLTADSPARGGKKAVRRSSQQQARPPSSDEDDDSDKSAHPSSSSDDNVDEEEEDDDDDDAFEASTPRRKRLRRSPGRVSTPTSTRKRYAIDTTNPAPLPKRRRPTNVATAASVTSYEEARQRLHVSAVPDSLPCREDEFAAIYGHLEAALQDQRGACIYISGVPGTGKTATVYEVMRTLQEQSGEDKELPEFTFVEVNGMKVLEPNQSYSILYQAITQQKVTPAHAQELLSTMYTKHNTSEADARKHQPLTVVLLDELDLLVTKRQGIMYNFFDWPNQPHARLIVVAVANTMDLPERMLTKRVSSRMGLTRVDFQPYSESQLIQILKSRVGALVTDQGKDIAVVSENAMTFAARKVANVNGDARRLLDICRRAVEIVERRSTQDGQMRSVEPPDIANATNEMYSSTLVKFLRQASLHQKLAMITLMNQLRKAGVNEVEYQSILAPYHQLCVVANLAPQNHSQLSAVVASLAAVRCLLLDSAQFSADTRIQLNMSEQDVRMALREDPQCKRLL